MSKALEILSNTIGTLAAVVVGGYLASRGQDEIWKKEKLYSMRLQLFDKRGQIMREIFENLADSARFAYFIGPSADTDRLSKLVYCADLKNRDQSSYCKELNVSEQEVARLKELASRRAQFEALSAMANIYFCSDTKSALRDVPAGDFWWNIDGLKKERLLTAMQSEMFCAIKFGDLEIQ